MEQLVSVTWQDAWFDFDQPDPAEAHDDYIVTTVGFLVADNPRIITLGQEKLPHGDGYRALTHIPRAVVVSVIPLMIRVMEEDKAV